MCVCNIWTDVKLLWLLRFYICRELFHLQGATAPFISPWPTKLLMFGEDMQSDQLHVPAFFGHSKGPSLEPQPQYYTICCTVVAIWNQCWNLHASEPSSDFRRNHIADSIMFLTYFCRDPVADELWVILGNNRRNIILDFNMLVKTLWNLVMTTFDNIGCPTSFSRSTSCGSFIHLII